MSAHQVKKLTTTGLALTLLCLLGAVSVSGGVLPSDFGRSEYAPFAHRRAGEAVGPRATIVNLDTSESFTTIQDAIDDPDTLNGHPLEVQGADHLEGQILINKSITLRGATGTETIRMAVDTGNVGDDRGWFLVLTGIDLQVRDLGFDGNGHLVFQAFRHMGNGSFTNCRFTDINYNRAGPDFAGYGIATGGGNVTVTDSEFSDIGRVGVLMVQGSTGTVEGCSYTGKGGGTFLDYGFEAGGGAVVTFAYNYATECDGLIPDYHASGILVSTFFGAGTTATLTGNTLMDNSHGISVGQPGDTSDVAASHNRLYTNEFGIESRSPTVNAENNWWGCNDGPGSGCCDPYKTVNGGQMDVDPWLVLGIAADPATIPTAGASALTADLIRNSDGDDTSGMAYVPDDIPVTFAAVPGDVAPVNTVTTDGMASSIYTAPTIPTTAIASAHVDCQTVQTPIQVIGLPDSARVPALGVFGAGILVLLLTVAGVLVLRR